MDECTLSLSLSDRASIIKDRFDEEIFGRCMESEDESFLGNVIAIEVTPRG